jgi:Tol biopolymer transport system component
MLQRFLPRELLIRDSLTRGVGLSGVVLALVGSASAQIVTLETLDPRGLPNMARNAHGNVSDDGRWLAFSSIEDWLPEDTNGRVDVFLRDRRTGAVLKTSVNSSGGAGNADCGLYPTVSPDGRMVLFASPGASLVLGVAPGLSNLYLHDRLTAQTELVSAAHGGVGGGNSNSALGHPASISADNRFVAFGSRASNLVAGVGDGIADQMFVRDRVLGVTECISATAIAGDAGTGARGSITRDGRYVVYSGFAGELTSDAPAGTVGVFVHDRATRISHLVSRSTGGAIGNGVYAHHEISGNGRFVSFLTSATNLDPLDPSSDPDLYVHDRVTGVTRCVTTQVPAGLMESVLDATAASNDGSFVVLTLNGNVPAQGDTNDSADVYKLDTLTGQFTLLSPAHGSAVAAGFTLGASLTPDGRFLVATSTSPDLAFDAQGMLQGVFVVDLEGPAVDATQRYCTGKLNSAGCTPSISLSGQPSVAGPGSGWLTGSELINSASGQLIWSLAPASVPFHGGTLCLAAPRIRTGAMPSGGSAQPALDCTGSYSFHFSSFYMAQRGLGAGLTIYAQYYQRDRGLAAPNDIGLTDAVSFEIAP